MAGTTRAPARKRVVKKSASEAPVKATSRKDGTDKIVLTHSYVPDIAVAQKYVGRQVWGIYDKILADVAREDGVNMLLEGETGSGKTLFGEAYASHERLPYYSLPCDVSIDPTSLFGRRQPGRKQGEFPWADGPVTSIVRHGGVLNISEINFMTPKISASLYPLLDGRRYIPLLGHEGEVVRAHKGGGKPGGVCWCNLSKRECDKRRVLIIADMNPNYRGTMELNAAFRNRFEFKIPWNYDAEVEEKLVKFPTLRAVAKDLRELMGTDIMTPVSTNMLMEFEKFAIDSRLSFDFAVANFAAAFKSDEQKSVHDIFDLNKSKLAADIRYFESASRRSKSRRQNDDELEEVEVEFEEED